MRLLRVLLALPLCVVFAACSGSPAPPPPPLANHTGNYVTEAAIRRGGLSATATIAQQAPDACVVSFSSPDTLEGLTFVFQQDAMEVGYGGLSLQLDPRSIPGGAIARAMVSSIGKAMQDDGVVTELSDSGPLLSGTIEAGAFQLLLDNADHRPLKLFIPSEELEIEFVNFRFLD